MTDSPIFTHDERQALLALKLFPEQVRRLQASLPSILWRVRPAPTMTDVRDKLSDLARALARVEKRYIALSMPKSSAAGEALNRLYVAEQTLETEPDKLHDSLEIAGDIINRALADLPMQKRTHRVDGAGIVRLIHRALNLGHIERFDCTGYGDTPTIEAAPPFDIHVSRDVEPFPSIVRILSAATQRIAEARPRSRFAIRGASVPRPLPDEAFNPEWAIRQYLKTRY